MAQGKEWSKVEVMNKLEAYYKLGCSTTKACAYAGVPRTTVQTWLGEDEELRLKVATWQNMMNAQARMNWQKKLEAGDYTAANDWLSRREKDEFSLREERTGAFGEPITVKVVNYNGQPHLNANLNGNNTSAQLHTP